MKKELATFGMGCFWTPQLVFSKVPGVLKTEVGYMGGNEKKFSQVNYEQVCSGKTGHAEVTQITFDSDKIPYQKLLEIFWKNHNPTTKNRQGLDFGEQYRSIIFYHSAEQKKLAENSKKEYQKTLDKKIVTLVKPAKTFFKAEDYHQDYLKKHGRNTC